MRKRDRKLQPFTALCCGHMLFELIHGVGVCARARACMCGPTLIHVA